MDSEKRWEHRLELQADKIVRLSEAQGTIFEILGGQVEGAWVRFALFPRLNLAADGQRALAVQLQSQLGVPEVAVTADSIAIRQAPRPVCLLDLLEKMPSLPAGVIPIGLAEDKRPVLLNLYSPDTSPILVAANPAGGKTTLLRTIALALALSHKQSQIQLLALDATPHTPHPTRHIPQATLQPLSYLPHMLAEVTRDFGLMQALLAFLVAEMGYRLQVGLTRPGIVVLIDHVINLLRQGSDLTKQYVSKLIQKGKGAGIHLVLTTDRPSGRELDSQHRAHLTTRLIGQLPNAPMAQAATGLLDSQAERLLGQGDFLALMRNKRVHFQSAYLDDYDLHYCLDTLHRHRAPALVATQLNGD